MCVYGLRPGKNGVGTDITIYINIIIVVIIIIARGAFYNDVMYHPMATSYTYRESCEREGSPLPPVSVRPRITWCNIRRVLVERPARALRCFISRATHCSRCCSHRRRRRVPLLTLRAGIAIVERRQGN